MLLSGYMWVFEWYEFCNGDYSFKLIGDIFVNCQNDFEKCQFMSILRTSLNASFSVQYLFYYMKVFDKCFRIKLNMFTFIFFFWIWTNRNSGWFLKQKEDCCCKHIWLDSIRSSNTYVHVWWLHALVLPWLTTFVNFFLNFLTTFVSLFSKLLWPKHFLTFHMP